MRKFWNRIKLFFVSLAFGMRGADKLMSGSNKETDGSDFVGIEQQKEEESVYADLLRGEVTQEVRELRHNMYYAERKSHGFEWSGGGRAEKKTDMFDYSGKIYNTDPEYKVLLIQENKEDMSSLMENGIYATGEKVALSKSGEFFTDVRKDKRDFTIKIERGFIPPFRIEQYATKIIVKKNRNVPNDIILDIYVPLYRKQFDNNSKLFVREMEKIYMGDKRSDVVSFDKLSFITYNAYGSDDLVSYGFNEIQFFNIAEFDGSYVLQFKAVLENKEDLVTEFYDKEAQRKSDEHEARKGATVDVMDVIEAKVRDDYDVEKAKELTKELKND